MARLVVKPGSPTSREIQLKPGVNSIGRGTGNDFTIDEPSISTRHCEIHLENGDATIKDLGSTNGTFVNRKPVTEFALQSGVTIHLGAVEMLFESDAPVLAIEQEEQELAHARAWTPNRAAPPVALAPAVAPAPATAVAGSQNCKFHPKIPGRFLCESCQKFFCDVCVTTQTVGGVRRKLCRQCGTECVPVQVQLQREAEAGFWARLPGAFAYPVRGAGALIVLVGIIVFATLTLGQAAMQYGFIRSSIRMIIFGIILVICGGGYLFTFLQAILHSTSAGDRELPELPGISNFVEDVLLPFCRLALLVLCCFAPAIALGIWAAISHQPGARLATIAGFLFGCVYFPMAFLAVAILDSIAGANPLVVAVSIIKVPLEYLLTLLLLATAIAFRIGSQFIMAHAFPEGMTTQSIGKLLGMLGSMALTSFTTLYLVIVTIHVLGLIFVTRKDRLGWLG
jgi:hypothetical protein